MAVKITDKNWDSKDDIYTDWYECPKCKNTMIMDGALYCQDCGTKLKWDLSGKKEEM